MFCPHSGVYKNNSLEFCVIEADECNPQFIKVTSLQRYLEFRCNLLFVAKNVDNKLAMNFIGVRRLERFQLIGKFLSVSILKVIDQV